MEPLCLGASKSIVPENLGGSPTGLGLPRSVLIMMIMTMITIVIGASQVSPYHDDYDNDDDSNVHCNYKCYAKIVLCDVC